VERLDADDKLVVMVYDGTGWHTVHSIGHAHNDKGWQRADIDLSEFRMTRFFKVRFAEQFGAKSNRFALDDIRIVSGSAASRDH
jgi:hypothetical protein